ncbi:hypothetical protein F5880DRAFT_1592849 [Lentinula raphanica]|nr:hypothetical protein F5880DRAFT_1592849 [Lentinula raphanica]
MHTSFVLSLPAMLHRMLPRSLPRPMRLLMIMTCFSVSLVIAVPLPAKSDALSEIKFGQLMTGDLVWDKDNQPRFKWVKPDQKSPDASMVLCLPGRQICLAYNKYTMKIHKVAMQTETAKGDQRIDYTFFRSLAAVVFASRSTNDVLGVISTEFTSITEFNIQREFEAVKHWQTPHVDEQAIYIMLDRLQGPPHLVIASGYDPLVSLKDMQASPGWSTIRLGYVDPNSEPNQEQFQPITSMDNPRMLVDGKQPNCVCPDLLGNYCYCLMAKQETHEVREIASEWLKEETSCRRYHPLVVPTLNGKKARNLKHDDPQKLQDQIQRDLMNFEALHMATGVEVVHSPSYFHALFAYWKMTEMSKYSKSADFEKNPTTSFINPEQTKNARTRSRAAADAEPPRKKPKST